MVTEGDRRLADFLRRAVRELRALQGTGRLQDPMSRSEVDFLEQELRTAEARAAGGGAADSSPPDVIGLPGDPSDGLGDAKGERFPDQDP